MSIVNVKDHQEVIEYQRRDSYNQCYKQETRNPSHITSCLVIIPLVRLDGDKGAHSGGG